MDYSIVEYLWFFIIYAFLGWSIEVSFHTVTSGKFVNRGFLNGPICPIYGFGMIILIFLLGSLVEHSLILFIASFFLTSILEFITGFILEKIFDTKWWDYSEKPFNIKGYVCLSFSILWGLAAVFVFNIVHPAISNFISILDNTIGNILVVFFLAYFIADFIVTIQGILKINKNIRLINAMAERLKSYSDDIGENIYKEVTKVIKIKDTMSTKLDERKEELARLEKEYDELINNKPFVHSRLEKSFPNIKRKISEFEKYRKDK